MDEIAKRVRALADERGKNKERELARAADLTPVHVNKIIARGGENTSGTTLAKIAKAGGVTLDWLVTGDAPRSRVAFGQTDRERALAVFLESPNDLARKVGARIAAKSFKGAESWDAVLWLKTLINEYDRASVAPDAIDEETEVERAKHAAVRGANKMPRKQTDPK